MINLIKSEEFEMMKHQIEEYANGGSMEASFSHILRFWSANKQDLFHLLGNQLQVSTIINLEDERYLFREMRKAMIHDPFYELIRSRICDLKYEVSYSNRDKILRLFDIMLLIQGKCDRDLTITIKGVELEIPEGMKIMRALHKIAKRLNISEEVFEHFRLTHSQVLNAKNKECKLTLSIHPLDFITMSDNDCNWESCMSWENNGDYRLGTVEMMNSSYILMAYLEAEDPMSIGANSWNNKRWRQLFFVSPDLILAIRPFPYSNTPVTMQVLHWVRELAQQIGWTYEEELRTVDNYDTSSGHYFELSTDAMYNDIDCNHPAFYGTNLPEKYEVNFSGPDICMICGEEFNYELCSDLACEKHLQVRRCAVCLGRIDEDNTYWFGDMLVCQECYDEFGASCVRCGDMCHEEDLVSVHLTYNNQIISTIPILFCEDCCDNLSVYWNNELSARCVELSSLDQDTADLWEYDPDLIPESFDDD